MDRTGYDNGFGWMAPHGRNVWTVEDSGEEEDDEENNLGLLLMRMVLWWMNKYRGKNGEGEILGLNSFLGAKKKRNQKI